MNIHFQLTYYLLYLEYIKTETRNYYCMLAMNARYMKELLSVPANAIKIIATKIFNCGNENGTVTNYA